MEINILQKQIHKRAMEKGFYDAAISGFVKASSQSANAVTITVNSQTLNLTNVDKIYAKVGQVVMFASESTLPLGRVSSVTETSTGVFDVVV